MLVPIHQTDILNIINIIQWCEKKSQEISKNVATCKNSIAVYFFREWKGKNEKHQNILDF